MLNPAEVKLTEMGIQERIAQAISESGMSKSAIAKACGVSPSAVTQWVSGETKAPTAERLLKLARATRVSYTWLIDGRGHVNATDEVSERSLSPPDSNAELVDMEIVDGDEPLRPDEVWLPVFREVEFAAGDGATQVIENHGARERFSLPRLSRAGIQPENAGLAVAKGNSMEPSIHDGATIGIDKGCRQVIDGKIYALDHGGMLRVKRLYRMPLNRVRVVSDNGDEYPEEAYSLTDPDAPRIIGRVFWWENFD
ncbi:helix-turn-helix transcriptional regulator [Halomonas sp. ATCH28]|uniref:Helix-turn-helix transcriptional regulator n=1 Tax=Halomonas gemina TaxID=2945105 RepID=A0ABT0T2Z9_9GAMM|nr:helix-turn-helix transcriptional regulator [Halomonas gemina]MCL7941192.1 helix-turn-helix transcriptional regulator [Halomonas gemina]